MVKPQKPPRYNSAPAFVLKNARWLYHGQPRRHKPGRRKDRVQEILADVDKLAENLEPHEVRKIVKPRWGKRFPGVKLPSERTIARAYEKYLEARAGK